MRETAYATERASAEIGNCRIERIFVKAEDEGRGQEEIRFAWWPDGRMANRPLDLPEPQLLELMAEAIKRDVFTESFLQGSTKLLAEHARYAPGRRAPPRRRDPRGRQGNTPDNDERRIRCVKC
jgi:hypothetical protein